MMHPGSLDNGEADVEYTPNPDHRQSAQELWFRACDKRLSSLERQVHRMLNPTKDPISDSVDAYMRGLADGKSAVTHTEGDYVHVPRPEWEALIEELEELRSKHTHSDAYTDGVIAGGKTTRDVMACAITQMQAELEDLRQRALPVMDERGVLLSHDAYDMLERQAAIGRSVPWAVLSNVIWPQVAYADYIVLRTWLTAHAPEEAAE